MEEFGYAHRDTSSAKTGVWFRKLNISEELREIRHSAFLREIPVASDETLQFLMCQTAAVKPERILEIGTAVGCSAIAMHQACPSAHITTIEKDAAFYREAIENFKKCGAEKSITALFGDAAELLGRIAPPFDLIFMDCAKAQYVKYLPRLKSMLSCGGTLIADDVLLYGWASGEAEIPKKRRMLAKHIEEYLEAVTSDPELITCVVKVGDGAAVSVKKFD